MLLGLFFFTYSAMPTYLSKSQATVISDYASQFVTLYMVGQFFFLLIIGPTYVASAIAEERQRGTLDYLFTSDLTSREIIVGKYMSRLMLLLQYVIIGLPILALVQLIGGVSIEMILGLMLGTAGCLASLTALTLLFSVMSKNSKNALIRTFMFAVALLILWLILYIAHHSGFLGSILPPEMAPFVLQASEQLLHLNPVYTTSQLRQLLAATGNIEGFAIRMYGIGFLLHVVLAALLLLFSIVLIRRRFLKQIDRSSKRAVAIVGSRNPPVWENAPIYWKEHYFQGSWTVGYWFKRLLFGKNSAHLKFGVGAFVAALFFLFSISLFPGMVELGASGKQILTLVCFLTTFGMLVLAHFLALIRTTSGIATEKDRDTWDALIASPVSVRDIILSRIYGGFLSARWLLLLAMLILCTFAIVSAFNRVVIQYPTQFNPYMNSANGSLSDTLFCIGGFTLANVGYLYFTLGFSAYFALASNSTIRNVMSALSIMLMINLIPWLARNIMGTGNSMGLLGMIQAITSPAFMVFLSCIAVVVVLALVSYYKFPRLRWIYTFVKWLGNLLMLNIFIFVVITCLFFAFGGMIEFSRLLMLVAPLTMDFFVLSDLLHPERYYYRGSTEQIIFFQLGSAAVFAVIGFLLYLLAKYKLGYTSGRVEHTRVAVKQRKLNKPKTVAGS
jgi:ABC-type transport system involved in multi-copper enzyme maturation permease subunit